MSVLQSCLLLPLIVALCYSQVHYSERPGSFSLRLLYYTSLETDGHTVISPLGIWSLMSGVALGATGNTARELRRALFLPKSERTLVNDYKTLMNAVLTPKSPAVTLASNNFMFLDQHFRINRTYENTIRNDFGAAINTLDFGDPASAAEAANNYIQNSGALVSNVLRSEDFAESRMLLTNAISFKGLWGMPFNTTDTTEEKFYNDNNEVIGKVNMMYQKAPILFSNIRELKARVIEMPYGQDGKYSMLIILPYPKVTCLEVLKTFKTYPLKNVFKALDDDLKEFGSQDIELRIPRFRISTNVMLNKPLSDMGVYDIFEPRNAEFGKVSNERLFVSAIVHKAEIEVSESGTVATASTTAEFSDRISPPSFRADRPFLYFVMEKSTATAIFSGIYSKPSVF